MKEEMMQVSSEDFTLLMLGCFRYALGRHSYMPGFVRQMLKEHIEVFHAHQLKMIADEIKEQFPSLSEAELNHLCETDRLDFDREAWLVLADKLAQRAEEIK